MEENIRLSATNEKCKNCGGDLIFNPKTQNLDCEKCGQSKTVKLRTGCLHSNDSNCRKCNTKLNFVILSANISNIVIIHVIC